MNIPLTLLFGPFQDIFLCIPEVIRRAKLLLDWIWPVSYLLRTYGLYAVFPLSVNHLTLKIQA